MKLEKETALIEAILFLESEPLDAKALSRISGLPREAVLQVIDTIRETYGKEEHGLELTELGGGFLLSPKKDLWDFLKDRYGKKNDNRLSRAAMETLSIIAYSQPITRAEIDGIRGVASDGMVRLLLSRALIREVGKKDVPGKPVQYGTTRDFLKLFRLNSISDLPKLDEVDKDRFELDGSAKTT